MREKYFFAAFPAIIAAALFAAACSVDPPDPRKWELTEFSLNRSSVVLNLYTETDYDHRTAKLTVSIQPPQANQDVLWGSNNNSVAKVEDGLVTAVSVGKAVITAMSPDGGRMSSCSVEVVDMEPGQVVSVILPSSITLYIGGTSQQKLIPVFTPVFVIDEGAEYESSNTAVAAVHATDGLVTAAAPGTAVITVTTRNGGHTDTCLVYVIPLQAQFAAFEDFLTAGDAYYKPGFDFGTDPSRAGGDSAANVSTFTGSANSPDFSVISDSSVEDKFGAAGAGNLVPKTGPSGTTGPYRSLTQYNYASIAHFAFTGFRQAHPWGINAITSAATRAGQTWSTGVDAYAANTNTVQFSGLGVDLGSDKMIDTVVIYSGGNITNDKPFNDAKIFNIDKDPQALCPGIYLEYMPGTAASFQETFDRLYKANQFGVTTANWNNPAVDNNWPAPGYEGSPWISAGVIVPDGTSWVYVFYFEKPVLARFLRCSFEMAPVAAPAAGYLGRAFVNSFEVYNTRSVP